MNGCEKVLGDSDWKTVVSKWNYTFWRSESLRSFPVDLQMKKHRASVNSIEFMHKQVIKAFTAFGRAL